MPSPGAVRPSVPGRRRPRRRPVGRKRSHFKPIGQRPRGGFVPYSPLTKPPAGSYDPALDAQERAAQRGYGDLQADTGTANLRSRDDLRLGLGQISTQRNRNATDFMSAIGEQTRQYGVLGNVQGQAARAQGIELGGVVAQAAAKRAANMARERVPMVTAFQRSGQDLDTATGRLATEFGRDWSDRNLALTRGGRENVEFGQDINAQRFFEAKQSGAVIPSRPENEFTKSGLTYRVTGKGAKRRYTLPSGRRLKRKGFIKTIRRRRKGPGNRISES